MATSQVTMQQAGTGCLPPVSLGWAGALVMCCLSGLLSCPAGADVYSRRDDDGVVYYTNTPDHGLYKLTVALLKEDGWRTRAGAAPLPAAAEDYVAEIEKAAVEHDVEKELLHAVIAVESGYNASAVSRAGAQGLMQLMPDTAKRYKVRDAFDPVQNVRGGARYLKDLMAMFSGDMELALAAYNAGEGAVIRHGRKIPPYRETQSYVPKVMRYYAAYKARN